jgi:hypothetical protein
MAASNRAVLGCCAHDAGKEIALSGLGGTLLQKLGNLIV